MAPSSPNKRAKEEEVDELEAEELLHTSPPRTPASGRNLRSSAKGTPTTGTPQKKPKKGPSNATATASPTQKAREGRPLINNARALADARYARRYRALALSFRSSSPEDTVDSRTHAVQKTPGPKEASKRDTPRASRPTTPPARANDEAFGTSTNTPEQASESGPTQKNKPSTQRPSTTLPTPKAAATTGPSSPARKTPRRLDSEPEVSSPKPTSERDGNGEAAPSPERAKDPPPPVEDAAVAPEPVAAAADCAQTPAADGASASSVNTHKPASVPGPPLADASSSSMPPPSQSRRPSQIPIPSPLSSPRLKAAEASLRGHASNGGSDGELEYTDDDELLNLRQMLGDIQSVGSQAQSQSQSQSQAGRQDSQPEPSQKKPIKKEPRESLSGKGKQRAVAFDFDDVEGADVRQPIDVDMLELSDSPPPPAQAFKPKKRKRALSSPRSLSDSPEPTPRKKISPPPASQPKTKKPRSSSVRGANKSRHRHQRFWHLDGSVVVQVEDILFRLHRSRLVSESEYFAQLFGQRGEGDDDDDEESKDLDADREIIDRCPVYKIRDPHVTSREFETLLSAMEDAITYLRQRPSFSVILSVLRVSTHLRFPKFRDWALAEVEEVWGGDLEGIIQEWRSQGNGNRGGIVQARRATRMITVAKECGLNALLRRAFYEVLRTAAFGQGDDFFDDDEDVDSALLPKVDFNKLLAVREHLTAEWMQACKAPRFACPLAARATPGSEQLPSPGSSTPARTCPTEAEKMLAWADVMDSEDVKKMNWGTGGFGYCDDCVQMRKSMWTAHRKKIWENMEVWLASAGLL